MMQQRREINLLQNLAGGQKGLGVDAEQYLLASFHRVRMGNKIAWRKDPRGGDLGDRAEPLVRDLPRHGGEGLATLRWKTGGGIGNHELGNSVGMRNRKCECDRAAETVADQHCIIADAELVEAILDSGHVGVHQCEHWRFGTVKTRQIDERHATACSERGDYGVESMPIREQRMQYDHVRTAARAYCGQRASARGKPFELHVYCPLQTPGPTGAAAPYARPSPCLTGYANIATGTRDSEAGGCPPMSLIRGFRTAPQECGLCRPGRASQCISRCARD